MIEQQIEQDLKTAMLARDQEKTQTLRGIKSEILYYKVANSKRDSQLDDKEVIMILSKESKKRQESSDLYVQGGNKEKSDKELQEKQLIDHYLPTKISNAELEEIINRVIAGNPDSNMGQIIGLVRNETLGSAEGGDIARLVKEKLDK